LRCTLFRSNFLLIQTKGNQNTHVCLEEKRHCAETEQQKQLSLKVRAPLVNNATQTHRDRLYTARESVNGEGFAWLDKRATGTFHGNSNESIIPSTIPMVMRWSGQRRLTVAQKPKALPGFSLRVFRPHL